MAGAAEAGVTAAQVGSLAAGALERAEFGALGGLPGMIATAALGAGSAKATSPAFRSCEAPQQQSFCLGACTLDNQSQSVQPLQPRLRCFEVCVVWWCVAWWRDKV